MTDSQASVLDTPRQARGDALKVTRVRAALASSEIAVEIFQSI